MYVYYTCPLANQPIHPSEVSKLVPAICQGNGSLHSVWGGEVGLNC